MRLAPFLAVVLVAALPVAAQTPAPKIAPDAPAPRPAPRAPQSLAAGGIGGGLTGFQPMRPLGSGLVGLQATGDAAPQCRTACAKAHNQCGGGGDDDCETRWTQCVAACRTAR